MTRLEQLAKKKPSFLAFLGEVRSFPRWFLQTDQEKRMGIRDFQVFYDRIRGNK